jgi:hypothetical protein
VNRAPHAQPRCELLSRVLTGRRALQPEDLPAHVVAEQVGAVVGGRPSDGAEHEIVETGEVMVFLGPDFVITVRHGDHSSLRDVRRTLEREHSVVHWSEFGRGGHFRIPQVWQPGGSIGLTRCRLGSTGRARLDIRLRPSRAACRKLPYR